MSLRLMLACAAAGAVAGLLLAPETGASMRSKISEKLEDAKERWYKVKNSSSEIEELKEVFKSEIAGLKEDTRKRVLEILESTRITGNHLKAQVLS